MCRFSKWSMLFVLLLIVALTACAPAATPVPPTVPAPQVIEVTTVVEVTKVVEKSITATPLPTAKPAFEQLPLPKHSISKKVTVNDNKMWLECYGSGSPTVILEHGYGVDSSTWHTIIPQLVAKTQVCAYDRINTGYSTVLMDTPRTVAQAADELDALLKIAKIDGPYVVAGHSLGGYFVLTYASHNPAQVAGAVLVDSAYLDDCPNTLKLLPTPSPDEARVISDLRAQCENQVVWKPEGIVDLDPAVRAVKSLGDIPLITLVHGSIGKAVDASVGMPADLVKQLVQRGQEEQKGYAKLSTDSTFMIAEDSSHSIQNDEPQLVIDAILNLVEKARQK
jgi:pimeloyl-ACP methyl ester carboxylesterase